MGRSRRSVYDPTVEQDQLLKSSLTSNSNPFANDPLAKTDAELEDDIRNLNDFRDAALHNDVTISPASRRRRMRQRQMYWCLLVGGFLLAGGVIAVLFVFVFSGSSSSSDTPIGNDNNGGDNGGAGGSSNPDIEGEPTVKAPPDTLVQLCQRDRVSQEEFRGPCQDTCDLAQCCWKENTTQPSCWEANPDSCPVYQQACPILDQIEARPRGVILDPPPATLRDACKQHNLATYEGYEECKAACEPSACCDIAIEDAVHTCVWESHESCIQYHDKCVVLQYFLEPDPNMAEHWDNYSHTYISLELPDPPSFLRDMCSYTVLNKWASDAYDKCKRTCDKAACCHFPASMPGKSCLEGHEHQCHKYHKVCAHLQTTEWSYGEDSELEDLVASEYNLTKVEPNTIKEACQPSKLTTPEGIEACWDLCDNARCCFNKAGDSCRNDPQCEDYVHCFHYDTLQYEHEDIPTLIEQVCDGTENDINQLELCRGLCDQAACCFDPDRKCPENQDYTYCVQYERCSVLFLDPNVLPVPPDRISEVCAASKVQEDASECEHLCAPGACCDLPHEDDAFCGEGNEIVCSTYTYICDGLRYKLEPEAEVPEKPPQPPEAADDLSVLCDPTDLQRDACADACSQAVCCTLREESSQEQYCADDYPDLCHPYRLYCNVLTPDIYPPPDNIEQACANIEQADSLRDCQDACSLSNCCNYPSNMPELSCVAGNEHVCKKYHESCFVLGENADVLEYNEYNLPRTVILRDVYKVCRAEQLTTPEKIQACHDICEPARCCWASDEPTCVFDDRCSDYELCWNYKALHYEDQDVVDLVKESCKDLHKESQRDACGEVCEQAVCCFAPGTTCPNNDWSACDQYSDCAFFFQDASGKYVEDQGPTGEKDDKLRPILYPPHPAIGETCTADNFDSDPNGRQACEEMCALSKCCDYPSNIRELSCLAGNEPVCKQYHGFCQILRPENDDPSATPLKQGEYDLPDADVNLAQVCEADALTSTENIKACSDICTAANCCYARSIEESCLEDDRCADYDLCFNYKALQYVHEDIPALIESTCSGDLENNVDREILCQDVCAQAVCCFNDKGSNAANSDWCGSDVDYCPQYAKCAFLFDGTKHSTGSGVGFDGVTRADVTAVCSALNLDLEKCIDICDPGRCCWDTEESDCTGTEDCSVYGPCKDVLED